MHERCEPGMEPRGMRHAGRDPDPLGLVDRERLAIHLDHGTAAQRDDELVIVVAVPPMTPGAEVLVVRTLLVTSLASGPYVLRGIDTGLFGDGGRERNMGLLER